MTAGQNPKIAPDLIWRMLDDNAVIVSPNAGKVRVFNGIGTVIWRLLSEKNTLTEIETHLIEHYDVSPEQVGEDLQIFLDELTERGLLV